MVGTPLGMFPVSMIQNKGAPSQIKNPNQKAG